MNYFLAIAGVLCGVAQGMNLHDSPRLCATPSPVCRHRVQQDSDMEKLAKAERYVAAQKISEAQAILEECAKKTNEQGKSTRLAEIARLELANIVKETDARQAKKLFKSVSESQLLGALAQKHLDDMSKPKSLSQSVENN